MRFCIKKGKTCLCFISAFLIAGILFGTGRYITEKQADKKDYIGCTGNCVGTEPEELRIRQEEEEHIRKTARDMLGLIDPEPDGP